VWRVLRTSPQWVQGRLNADDPSVQGCNCESEKEARSVSADLASLVEVHSAHRITLKPGFGPISIPSLSFPSSKHSFDSLLSLMAGMDGELVREEYKQEGERENFSPFISHKREQAMVAKRLLFLSSLCPLLHPLGLGGSRECYRLLSA
jgi:hypothetical protein